MSTLLRVAKEQTAFETRFEETSRHLALLSRFAIATAHDAEGNVVDVVPDVPSFGLAVKCKEFFEATQEVDSLVNEIIQFLRTNKPLHSADGRRVKNM